MGGLGGARLRRVLVLTTVVVATAAAGFGTLGRMSSALAQTETETPESILERARRAHDLGHLDEAIAAYGRAYQASGDPRLLFEMAEAQREAGHDAEALRSFKTYLRRDPAGTYRASAEKEVQDIEQQLKTEGASKGGAVVATPRRSASQGAAVVGPVPGASRTPPAAPVQRAVAPPAAATPPRTVTGQPAVAAPAAAVTTVPAAVAPEPSARLAPLPTTTPPPLSTGLRASAVNGGPTSTTAPAGVDISRPSEAASGTATSALPRWVPWVLGATTLALATSTVISGLSAASRFDELKNSCGLSPTGCPKTDIDDVQSRAKRTNVLLVLTGVAAVGTGVAVYFTLDSAGATGQWRF